MSVINHLKLKQLKRKITLIAIAALSPTLFAFELTVEQKIDDLLQQYHALNQFNGVALVAHRNKILINKGYGHANFEWDIQHKTTGKFKIASVTKQFTALLILQLVEQNKLQLDKTIDHYLPNYRSDTGSKITIRHLLNHTSGLGNFFHLKKYQQIEARNPFTLEEFVEQFCSEDLSFEPGSQFRYSNAGYTLLGLIIEKITGKTYKQALQANIFDPAGMKNSGFNDQQNVIPQRVSGYERTLNYVKHPEHVDMSIPYSSGSIYSTSGDMLLWHKALQQHALLSEPLTQILYRVTPHRNYAAGWLVDSLNIANQSPLTMVHQSGGIQGFNANIARILEDDLVVILMNNTGGAPMRAMTNNIINIVYQQPVEQPRLRFNQTLYKIITTDGLDSAINWYLIQQADNNGYSERGLNRFGYELIEAGELEAAIRFFEVNTRAHAKSANTFDSLAEAHYLNGNISSALKNYQKAQLLTEDKSYYDKKIAELSAKLNQ